MKKILTVLVVVTLSILLAGPLHAQSSWERCTDGKQVIRCETYDCPQGDTNSDRSCTLEDNGARLVDVRNDSFCANPQSGCGEVRYYPSGNVSACLVRVEETDNNCDLFSTTDPDFSSPSPAASPTSNPSTLTCSKLSVLPSQGVAPLRVTLTASANGPSSQIKEYEFKITAPGAQEAGIVTQASRVLSQTLAQVGTYQVEVTVIGQDDSRHASQSCKTQVKVLDSNRGIGGGDIGGNETLPDTGAPLWVGAFFILTGLLGFYLYERYKFT